MVDAFCNAISKCIKKHEKEYYKSKDQTEENQNDANEQQAEENIDFARFDVTYKDMMKMIVCDVEGMECMVHRCANCPGYPALQAFIESKFTE